MKKIRALTIEFIDANTINSEDKMTLAYHIYIMSIIVTGYQRIGAGMIIHAIKDYLPLDFWKSELETRDSIDTYWTENFIRYNCNDKIINENFDHIIEEESEKIPIRFVANKWKFSLQITFVD